MDKSKQRRDSPETVSQVQDAYSENVEIQEPREICAEGHLQDRV